MITYNKESLNRIAQSLEKMAGVNPDTPVPSEDGNIVRVTFTIVSTPEGMEPVENMAYMTSDKSAEEIVDAIVSGSYVYANVVVPPPDDMVGSHGYIAVPVSYVTRIGRTPCGVTFHANVEEQIVNNELHIMSMTVGMNGDEEYATSMFTEAVISLKSDQEPT